MNAGRTLQTIRWAGGSLALAAIVVAYRYWLHTNPTTVALTLLLFILIVAARWGLRYAIAMAVGATACFNFFFLPPVGTFTIADTQNWIALFAFLATAVIGSQLSNRMRAEAQRARERQHDVETLFQLSRELLQTEKVAELLHAIPRCVANATRADEVALYLEQDDQVYNSELYSQRNLDRTRLRAGWEVPCVEVLDGEAWNVIPLHVGVKPRGVLLLKIESISAGVRDALGGLVSIAIDRAQALEGAARSEAAKESERLRTVLLDSITHELRTPLTAIKASASALLSTRDMSKDVQTEMLTVIDEESDRLNRLIAQAVQMAQLDAHEVHMNLAPHTLRHMIDDARQACASALASRRIEIDLPDHLPSVLVDRAWITCVLCNLIENAAKFSPGSEPICVTACLNENESIAVSVTDRGTGIDPAEQELVFEKFYRGRKQKHRVPGTGMGLAICRAIVIAHQGSLSVKSELGSGSTFTFTCLKSG